MAYLYFFGSSEEPMNKKLLEILQQITKFCAVIGRISREFVQSRRRI